MVLVFIHKLYCKINHVSLALAFEELTALYFKGQWSDDKNKYEVYSKVSLKQNAMGIVSNNPNITRLIRSFMDTNEDAIDIIYSAGRKVIM